MSNQYFERFADALPDPKQLAEKKKELEAAGVKNILSCWIDMFGVPKPAQIIIARRRVHPTICWTTLFAVAE